jgi:hypothetical protein
MPQRGEHAILAASHLSRMRLRVTTRPCTTLQGLLGYVPRRRMHSGLAYPIPISRLAGCREVASFGLFQPTHREAADFRSVRL